MSTRELDLAGHLASEAIGILRAARRSAGRGVRAAGPEGDEHRAELLAMIAEADEALYEARLVLDRLLSDAALRDARAPRPVIVLPA